MEHDHATMPNSTRWWIALHHFVIDAVVGDVGPTR